MILIPLLIILLVVGIVYVVRIRHQHAIAAAGGNPATIVHHAQPISPVGWTSLIVLLTAVVFWALTYSVLPIYYTASIAGLAFLLAVGAVTVRHDRSPMLLIPLLAVPLAAAFSIAFVLLQ